MMISEKVRNPDTLGSPNKVYRIGRIVIIESCPMIQTGLRRLLSPPCFQVEDWQEVPLVNDATMSIMQLKSDLVIIELHGEGGSILERLRVVSKILQTSSSTPLVICTAIQDPRLLKHLLSMGVKGIYLKQDPLSTLTQCVFQVMDGLTSYSPTVVDLLAKQVYSTSLLTGREMTVLDHLLGGKNVTDIAHMLHRDIRTISTHKRSVMSKLEFQNDNELYTWGAWLSCHGLPG